MFYEKCRFRKISLSTEINDNNISVNVPIVRENECKKTTTSHINIIHNIHNI